MCRYDFLILTWYYILYVSDQSVFFHGSSTFAVDTNFSCNEPHRQTEAHSSTEPWFSYFRCLCDERMLSAHRIYHFNVCAGTGAGADGVVWLCCCVFCPTEPNVFHFIRWMIDKDVLFCSFSLNNCFFQTRCSSCSQAQRRGRPYALNFVFISGCLFVAMTHFVARLTWVACLCCLH